MSEEITVVEWVDDSDIPEDVKLLSWMGGWFNFGPKGQRWQTYLDNFTPTVYPYLEAVRRDVVKNGYRFTGEQHQTQSAIPKFSDGTYMSLTWRAWGDLMAAIWSEEENVDYNYMNFYM